MFAVRGKVVGESVISEKYPVWWSEAEGKEVRGQVWWWWWWRGVATWGSWREE